MDQHIETSTGEAPTRAVRNFLRGSISLADIWNQIWGGRWIVVAATITGLVWGIYSVATASPRFTAIVRIVPASGGESDGGAALGASNLLAGLTGGIATAGSVPKFMQFTATIHSIGVAELMDRRYGMLCRIYRGECDQKTHIWRKRKVDISAWLTAQIARLGHLPDPNGSRTTADLAGYLRGIVADRDKLTGIVELSFIDSNPKFAAEFLSKAVTTTNDYLRGQDRDQQRKYVTYVADQVTSSTNVAQRETLSNLLLQQERKLMMTEVDTPYAATILDGPIITPVNQVIKYLALYSLAGFVIGILLVLGKRLVPNKLRWSQRWKRS